MSPRRIRKIFVPFVILALAVGVFYSNFAPPKPGGLISPSRQMSGMQTGEEFEAHLVTAPPTFDVSGPVTGEVVYPASFDLDVRDLPQVGPELGTPLIEMPSPRSLDSEGRQDANFVDPVVQTTGGILAMPGYQQSFKGLDLTNWGAGWPPDTHGDVGPNHYIQAVNNSVAIFNKTGTRLAAYTLDTFFDGTGTSCDADNNGDPVVVYDPYVDRWIVTDFAWTNTQNGPYYECIAISKTSDPVSGGWWQYGFRADDATHAWLNDYPKLGVWADGIYMGVNMFDCLTSTCSSATYKGVRVWALNRDDMISGAALRSVRFDLGSGYFSVFPSNARGALPPSGTPNFFTSIVAPSTLQMWKFHVDWTNTANSTFTGPTNISVASFSEPSVQVPQLGSTEQVDTLGDRLMVQIQYRNRSGTESLWATHSVATGGVTGIRWYEIRNPNGTPSVYQQGTYQPDSNYRWMGSLAVDSQGNMAVGYSVSSSSMYPAIRYAGRLATDTLGTLGQGEATLIAGTGSQSGGYNRWGDYASMSVDPVDDCTFWFTTEYYETVSNNWQTRIGSFKFPSCGGTSPTPTNTSVPPTATNTSVPPTATNTSVPPTATNTSLPPTATNTPLPPTATYTPGACTPAGGYCKSDNESRTWLAGTTNQSITGDDATKNVALPFAFTFAGTSYSSINISSNGNAHFATASTAYSNATIPTSSAPNALIAALWDDLNPSAGGAIYTGVYGTAPNRTFVIEWRDVRRYNSGTTGATFAIQLDETSNHVWILYQDTLFGDAAGDNGVSATSGLENAAGTDGNLYSYNTAALTNGKVLHFWPSGGTSPTNTPVPPTNTPVPPTNTPVPPTATPSGCTPVAGYCKSDNETRVWLDGTTNQSITGDDATKNVALPFAFTFAGTSYSSINISSNGNAHFATASTAYNNVAMPNSAAPNALIAALWDDLNPSAGGAIYTGVYGTAPNRTFVIEWRDVRRYNAGTSGATFEIQLDEGTNHIWILYLDTVFGSTTYDSGLSATSGVENAAGTLGNQYSYNVAVLTNGKVLHYWPQ